MKIGIEAQRIFRKNKHGMEVVAIEIIRELQKIDTKNEYVVFVRPDEDDLCIKETSNFRIRKVDAMSFPDWEQIALPRAAKSEKVDILHCTSNTGPLLSPAPMLLTLHDIIYLEKLDFSGTPYQNFGNLYRRLIVPRVVKKSKKVITVSEFEKRRIIEFMKVKPEKVECVYNAASEAFSVIEDHQYLNSISKKHKLPAKFILFFGNTAPKKNTRGMLKAYSIYCDQNTDPLPLVVTDFDESHLNDLLKEINCEKIKSHILLTGHIDFQELPAIYNLASLFVYPSLRESFGLPIVEAMRCGTPVITSNTSSMPEVAGGAALLADPLKPAEIGKHIIDILADEKLYAERKKSGLENGRRFSWKNSAQHVLNMYLELKNSN